MTNHEGNLEGKDLLDWLLSLPPADADSMRDIFTKMDQREEQEARLLGIKVVPTNALPPNTALLLSEDMEHPGQINPKNSVMIKLSE